MESSVPTESEAPISTEVSAEAPLSTEVSVEAPVTTEVSAETETAVNQEVQPAEEAFDIEAELDKREARAKKFGAEFNREQCRAQLLKTNAKQSSSLREDVLAARRARFGGNDKDKMQARKQRFGGNDEEKMQARKQRFAEPTASQEVLSAREARFGKVDENYAQNLRGRKRFGNRRNENNGKRIFHCAVCGTNTSHQI